MVKVALSLLFAGLLIVPACNSNQPRTTQAASEPAANPQGTYPQGTNASDQMKQERDEYVKSTEARLSEFDKNIDGLDQRAGALKGTAKSNSDKLIDELRNERKEVGNKLDDLKSVNVESWMTMKGEVDSAMAGMQHAYDQASRSIPTMQPTTPQPVPQSTR